MALRIIAARFPGKCRTCPAQIEPGQSIEYNSATRTTRCMMCVDPQDHAQVRKDGTKAAMPTQRGIRPSRTYEELFGNDDD